MASDRMVSQVELAADIRLVAVTHKRPVPVMDRVRVRIDRESVRTDKGRAEMDKERVRMDREAALTALVDTVVGDGTDREAAPTALVDTIMGDGTDMGKRLRDNKPMDSSEMDLDTNVLLMGSVLDTRLSLLVLDAGRHRTVAVPHRRTGQHA